MATHQVSQQSLNITVWNVRSLASKRYYKLTNPDSVNILVKYDIIMLTKTWSNDKCDLQLPGYEHLAERRTKSRNATRSSGGLAVYYAEL